MCSGVVTTPEALLILHSGYEFFPIEAGAFADVAEMEAVAARIRDWIAAAGASGGGRAGAEPN